jgi:hypothetical protein
VRGSASTPDGLDTEISRGPAASWRTTTTWSPFGAKSSKGPFPAAKEKLTELAADWPMAFTAYVFEAEGFDAAAVRGVDTGVVLIARPSYPIQLHRSVADAARWVEMIARLTRRRPRSQPCCGICASWVGKRIII